MVDPSADEKSRRETWRKAEEMKMIDCNANGICGFNRDDFRKFFEMMNKHDKQNRGRDGRDGKPPMPSAKEVMDKFGGMFRMMDRAQFGAAAMQISPAPDHEIDKIFKMADTNSDGKIDEKELEMILATQGKDGPDGGMPGHAFKMMDMDGDGKIHYEEFKAFQEKMGAPTMTGANMPSDDMMKQGFLGMYDKNGDGAVEEWEWDESNQARERNMGPGGRGPKADPDAQFNMMD